MPEPPYEMLMRSMENVKTSVVLNESVRETISTYALASIAVDLHNLVAILRPGI